MPRPSKLTDQVFETIVRLVRAGNWLEVAAAAAGVHRSTVYDWLARGEADPPAEGDERYVDFALALRAAEAEAEIDAVRDARAGKSRGKQRGAVWWLERKHPKRYGRRQALEHSGPDGGPIESTHAAAVMFLPPKDGDE